MAGEYAAKLRDPRWQKKRLEILERDHWMCEVCGSQSDTLHVHHGYYEKGKEPWEYPGSCFHTLCEPCHQKAKNSLRTIRVFFGVISIESVYLAAQFIESLKSFFSCGFVLPSAQETRLEYMEWLNQNGESNCPECGSPIRDKGSWCKCTKCDWRISAEDIDRELANRRTLLGIPEEGV